MPLSPNEKWNKGVGQNRPNVSHICFERKKMDRAKNAGT
jgi:hypothetical protein